MPDSSCLPQLQKSTPMERGRHQRCLANSGAWVPIKGEPGTPHLPLTCPRACWGGTEGRAPCGFRSLRAPHTHACSHRIQLRLPGDRHSRDRRAPEGLAGIHEQTGHALLTSERQPRPSSPCPPGIRSGGGAGVSFQPRPGPAPPGALGSPVCEVFTPPASPPPPPPQALHAGREGLCIL